MDVVEEFVTEAQSAAATGLSWLGPGLVMTVLASIAERAPTLVLQVQGGTPSERAEGVRCILDAVWGCAEPPDDWWSTPLGRLCAAGLTGDQSEVTWATAARMLRVAPGTVARMMARGNTELERLPSGHIRRGSVFRVLAQRNVAPVMRTA